MPRTPEAMFFDNFAGHRPAASGGAPRRRARAHWRRRERAYGPSRAFFDAPNGRSTTLDRLLYADMKTYLVELLMKQDQMSMAASIESRVPFLDHQLVEFAAGAAGTDEAPRIDDQVDPARGRPRSCPPEILTRKKMGFPVPFGVWMRGRVGQTSPATCCSIARSRAARHHRSARRGTADRRRTRPATRTAATRSGAC